MPRTLLSYLHTWYLVLLTAVKEFHYPDFMDEETEAQRDEAVCQKPQSWSGRARDLLLKQGFQQGFQLLLRSACDDVLLNPIVK